MNVPQQKITEVWDKLPLATREAILSDETTKQITQICKESGLSDDQVKIADEIVGDVLWGFIKSGDLRGELESKLKIDNQTASIIFTRIRSVLLEKLGIVTANLISNKETDETNNSSPLKPAFAPGQPFILHKEEARAVLGTSSIKPFLSRPSFYKPGFSQYSENYPEKSQAVKLELGRENQSTPSGQATIKVGREEARVVHYSEMRTPLDPFAKTVREPSQIEALKKKDVHPDNVINLKDLPL